MRKKIALVKTSEEGVNPTQNWPAHIVGFYFVFVSEYHIDQNFKELCVHTPVLSSFSSKSNIFMGLFGVFYYEMKLMNKIGTEL